MSSQPPLTEAEKAAREALSEWETFTASDGNTSIRMREARGEDELARAVVAAVRPLLAADALAAFADHLRALVATESFCDEAADSGMKLAASVAEDEAVALRQSLSLPASKETPDA